MCTRRRVSPFLKRFAFQRCFQFPDLPIARTQDRLERDARLASASQHGVGLSVADQELFTPHLEGMIDELPAPNTGLPLWATNRK
jgi:hypothetical protein